MKFTLFLPTLNEIDGVKATMPRINKEWIDEVLVVDGGSTDGTIEYMEQWGARVVRQKSKGLTSAEWEAFEAATGDVIILFTPDGNSIPELIPDLVSKFKEGYDMVIVSRYLGGASSEDDDFVTGFGNWMFTKIVNVLFGGHYTDVLVGFRAFKKEIIAFTLDEKTRPVLEIQMPIRCLKHKLKVCDIPGSEPKRIGGVRKMRPFYNGSCLVWTILKELFSGRSRPSASVTPVEL